MAIVASNQISIVDVTDGADGKMLYGTCSTEAATAAKVSTISGFSLYTGVIVSIKFKVTNTAALPTLNINSTGAKPIYYRGAAIYAGFLAANRTYAFVYNGTQWEFMGDINTDTFDRTRYAGNICASGTDIVARNIIVGNNGVYQHLKSGKSFDINSPILYAGSNITASKTGTNNYISINCLITTTQNITLTTFNPVYIKGTLSGTSFTPISTAPLTQTVPTTEDGYQYILLGTAASTNYMYLLPEHPIFQYFDGGFKSVNQIATEASKTATNYIKFDGNGLVIGNMTADTLGRNVLIDSDSVDIRNGSNVLASYGSYTTIGETTGKHILIDNDSVDIKNGKTVLSQFTDNTIYLGKNSRSSTIDLCNGTGRIYNSTENNSYLEVSVLTIESDDIVKLTTGHGILSKSTYSSDSWRAEAIIEVGAAHPSFWDTGTLGSNLSPYGNITLVAKNSYISDARKRKESCLSLSEDSAYISVRGLSVHMDPGYSCGIWLDGSSSTSTIRISSDVTTITGALVLSKTTDASGTANNSPALIVGGTATSEHLELDANEIMAKKDGTTVGGLTLNAQGGNVYIGRDGTGNLLGVCQVVTQGDLPPAPGQDTTKTIKYKSGRTKVLIEMWTTGPSGYYDSVYKTISSSTTAVPKTLLTKLYDSLGYFSISKSGDITLYNTTKSSATSTGLIKYRVTHFN